MEILSFRLKSPQRLACEQALRGALAAGQEKEGELATTSVEFEFRLQFPIRISQRLFRCRYSNSRDVVASSPSFSCPATRVPGKACSQANQNASFLTPVIFTLVLLYADGTPYLILLDCKLCINCIHETTRKGWHHHQLTIFLSKYTY